MIIRRANGCCACTQRLVDVCANVSGRYMSRGSDKRSAVQSLTWAPTVQNSRLKKNFPRIRNAHLCRHRQIRRSGNGDFDDMGRGTSRPSGWPRLFSGRRVGPFIFSRFHSFSGPDLVWRADKNVDWRLNVGQWPGWIHGKFPIALSCHGSSPTLQKCRIIWRLVVD